MASSLLLEALYDSSACTLGTSLSVTSKYTLKGSVALAPPGPLTWNMFGGLKAKVILSEASVENAKLKRRQALYYRVTLCAILGVQLT